MPGKEAKRRRVEARAAKAAGGEPEPKAPQPEVKAPQPETKAPPPEVKAPQPEPTVVVERAPAVVVERQASWSPFALIESLL